MFEKNKIPDYVRESKSEIMRTLVRLLDSGASDYEIGIRFGKQSYQIKDLRIAWHIFRDTECSYCGSELIEEKCQNGVCYVYLLQHT